MKLKNKRTNKIKLTAAFYIWASFSLIGMIAIFWFSSRSAEESGEMSSSLTRGMFGGVLDSLNFDGGESEVLYEILEIAVRKAAHFAVYFMLSFCVTNTFRQIMKNKRYIFWISLAWCSVYAATDEIHQYFVPGRACMWQDWALDVIGALFGIGAAFLIARCAEMMRGNKIGDSLTEKDERET
jgi:VanZ family protein